MYLNLVRAYCICVPISISHFICEYVCKYLSVNVTAIAIIKENLLVLFYLYVVFEFFFFFWVKGKINKNCFHYLHRFMLLALCTPQLGYYFYGSPKLYIIIIHLIIYYHYRYHLLYINGGSMLCKLHKKISCRVRSDLYKFALL